MIDYMSFLKKDNGTLPQCAEAMNKWLSENGVCVVSVETLWAASGGGPNGGTVSVAERGLRVWYKHQPD